MPIDEQELANLVGELEAKYDVAREKSRRLGDLLSSLRGICYKEDMIDDPDNPDRKKIVRTLPQDNGTGTTISQTRREEVFLAIKNELQKVA